MVYTVSVMIDADKKPNVEKDAIKVCVEYVKPWLMEQQVRALLSPMLRHY